MAGNDSYTKLLLHMNGLDASTVFTDDSASAHTMTAHGDAQIDTDQYKFGGASGLFDGNGDYVDTPTDTDFDLGTDPFTIDFWFRDNGTSLNYPCLVGNSGEGGGWRAGCFGIRYNNLGQANKVTVNWNDEGDPVIASTNTFATATWHHVALVRESLTVLKLYVNGTLEGSATISHTLNLAFGGHLTTGGHTWDGNDAWYKGWLDELRVSKGIARWTDNFTPPTAEYTGEMSAHLFIHGWEE